MAHHQTYGPGGSSRIDMSVEQADQIAWGHWWAANHPFDWWAKERGGEPVDHRIRLLVHDIAQQAFKAGRASLREGRSE